MVRKNKLLEAIAKRLSNREIDILRVMQELESNSLYNWDSYQYDGENLEKRCAEIGIRLSLRDIKQELGVGDRVNLNPIPDGAERKGYLFEYSYCGLKVYFHGEYMLTINQVIKADGLPVLVRLKLGRYSRRTTKNQVLNQRFKKQDRRDMCSEQTQDDQRRKHRLSRSNLGARYAMDEEYIALFSKPFIKYFSTGNLGYMLILYKDQVTDREWRGNKNVYLSEAQQDFAERNGILVPFYTDKAHFQEHVKKALKTRQSQLAMSKPEN